jgi:hypothetical protein
MNQSQIANRRPTLGVESTGVSQLLNNRLPTRIFFRDGFRPDVADSLQAAFESPPAAQ